MEKRLCVTLSGALGFPQIVDVSIDGKSLPVTSVELKQTGDNMPELNLKILMKHVNIKFESPTEE